MQIEWPKHFYMMVSLYLSLCPWINLSVSHSLNSFSQFSLTALMLVCITVHHWLELSALSEQHLSCWSVEYLYNSPSYQHEVRRDKKDERITENAIYRKAKEEQNLAEKSKIKSEAEEENERSGLERSCRGESEGKKRGVKRAWVKTERESGRAREQAKNAWQGLSILRQMDNVRSTAVHRTVSWLLFSSYLYIYFSLSHNKMHTGAKYNNNNVKH